MLAQNMLKQYFDESTVRKSVYNSLIKQQQVKGAT